MMRHVKHIYAPRTSVLTWHLDPLRDLFRIIPKSEQTFRTIIRTANLEKGIKGTEFQVKKERILILYRLLGSVSGLDKGQIRTLADAVLIRQDRRAALELLKVSRKADEGIVSGIDFDAIGSAKTYNRTNNVLFPTREERLWRDANNFASTISDSRFLSHRDLDNTPFEEYLRDAMVEAEETAHSYLRKLLKDLVDGIGQQIFSIQKAECDKQIQREITAEEDKKLGILRSKFVHQVQDLSRERSRSNSHNITQRISTRSVHVHNFTAKKEHYHSPGL